MGAPVHEKHKLVASNVTTLNNIIILIRQWKMKLFQIWLPLDWIYENSKNQISSARLDPFL